MASLTVVVGDGITSPKVTIVITETSPGVFTFNLTQDTTVGNLVGDLRGLFFDTALDGGGGLVASGSTDITDQKSGNDSVVDLGDGANMNGALNSDYAAASKKVAGAENNGFDFGVEFGSSGIGKDDIQSTEFTLTGNGLKLSDFFGMDFGIRATSVGRVTENVDGVLTFGEGREDSSKTVVDAPPKADSPPPPPVLDLITANNDDPACGVEGLVKVSGNLLDNDTHSNDRDLDITHVNGTALLDLDPTPDGDWYEFGITGGTLKINAETGSFEFTYDRTTFGDIEVGGKWDGGFTYTVTDGDASNDNAASLYTAEVDLCISGAAGSPGYWKQHDGSGPQANDWDIAQDTSFETFFGVSGPYAGKWDTSTPINGNGALDDDITLLQAITLGGGGGGQNLLAREATTALLNLLDEDADDAFITAYMYQRANFAAADADASNDLSGLTAAEILADLKAQVQDAFNGAPDAYTLSELSSLLQLTHE